MFKSLLKLLKKKKSSSYYIFVIGENDSRQKKTFSFLISFGTTDLDYIKRYTSRYEKNNKKKCIIFKKVEK